MMENKKSKNDLSLESNISNILSETIRFGLIESVVGETTKLFSQK